MNSIENLVYVELQDRLDQMSGKSPTTEEYKANMEVAAKLMEHAEKMEALNIQHKEQQLKEQQMEQDRKNRKWDRFVDVARITVPPVVALGAACIFSVVERTEIVSGSAPREFLKRALRLS